MDYITSKTHRYIKVRQYPSAYIIKKFHKNEPKAVKAFNNHTKLYNSFYKKFVEKVTGNDYDYYQFEYFLGAAEATKEEVHEISGIKVCESGDNVVYCIPKTVMNDDTYNWLIDQLEGSELKYKVLKKTVGTYMDHGVTSFHRDNNRISNSMRKKLSAIDPHNKNNKLKV